MRLHANAKLSVKGRELLVDRVEVAGWSLTQAAEAENAISVATSDLLVDGRCTTAYGQQGKTSARGCSVTGRWRPCRRSWRATTRSWQPPRLSGLIPGTAGDGARGTRTPDLLGAIQALSQLSYSPEVGTV